MTDHLPECDKHAGEYGVVCMCPVLRACEERVRGGYNDGVADGYAAALRDARDAVADRRVPWPTATGDLVNEGIDTALAAIDALRADHA